MNSIGFLLYITFMISWFLHLTTRFPALGAIRLDLLLVVIITALHFLDNEKHDFSKSQCYKTITRLILFAILITPFSEWPGSVVRFGLINFMKAIVFFFFSIWYLKNFERIKTFITVFILCQSFRILEPLYLHMTEGYWGSFASMGNWEIMSRLSGAPSDVINPNGLAFVILTIIPFLFVMYSRNNIWKLFTLAIGPAAVYALYLTGSRSGMLGLVIIVLTLWGRSAKKIQMGLVLLLGCLFVLPLVEGNYKDRYLSIFSSETKNFRTADGRIAGISRDLGVAMRRPLTGFGLGTSREANANFGAKDQVSHNVYTETFQELGIIGLILLVQVMISIVKLNQKIAFNRDTGFISQLSQSLFVLSVMNVFFGLASFGLSSYEWYFLGGVSVAIDQLSVEDADEKESITDCALACGGDKDLHPVRVS